MKKRSKMYNFSKEEVLSFIVKSSSVRELLYCLGFRDVGNNRKTLLKVIDYYNLNEEFLDLKRRSKTNAVERAGSLKKDEIADELIFCENSKVARKDVKSRILKRGILEYKCSICGNAGIYMGKPLILQLDHINGINNDNRLENLRFLCPNCHSQTETFSGRKLKQTKDDSFKNQEKEKLIQERKEYLNKIDKTKLGWVMQVARDWGVSWTSVKRWIKRNYPDLEYYQRETAVN